MHTDVHKQQIDKIYSINFSQVKTNIPLIFLFKKNHRIRSSEKSHLNRFGESGIKNI